MTRKYLAAITALGAVAFVSVITGTGCSSTGIGDPCIPEEEYAQDFLGFDEHEVNVESKSFQCETRLCLVNHFRGRVSCPYGQNPSGTAAEGVASSTFKCNGEGASNSPTTPCCLPGVDQPVISDQDKGKSTLTASTVQAQCSDRTAEQAVYCSCRCANVDGNTNDGANYCTCPDGFSCTQLVTPVNSSNTNAQLNGAYCIRSNTVYSQSSACTLPCSPTATSGTQYCGPTNSAQL